MLLVDQCHTFFKTKNSFQQWKLDNATLHISMVADHWSDGRLFGGSDGPRSILVRYHNLNYGPIIGLQVRHSEPQKMISDSLILLGFSRPGYRLVREPSRPINHGPWTSDVTYPYKIRYLKYSVLDS